ncbi:DUF805 domain-containing protein [Ferrovibrio sp.]|uniref:DUF805 domain-containing protein n=1 Tax=Ferrovibrio sp. TaxID=1917215 RepID=UPI003D09D453
MSKPVFSDLFTFSGRRNRKSYALLLLLALFPLLMLVIAVATFTKTDVGSIIALLILLLWLWFLVIGTNQRLKDIGWSGRVIFGLLLLLPLGFFLIFVLMLIPGEAGPNEYGPDPLGPPGPATA